MNNVHQYEYMGMLLDDTLAMNDLLISCEEITQVGILVKI